METTNKLMRGDWIHCSADKYREAFDAKIAEVYTNSIFTEDCDFECEEIPLNEISPIPLTAEILETNGFRKEEEPRGFSEPYCVYVNDGFQYVIKVYPKDIMDRYSRLEIGKYDDNEYMSLLINHVHELQHALKLADINLEITLN